MAAFLTIVAYLSSFCRLICLASPLGAPEQSQDQFQTFRSMDNFVHGGKSEIPLEIHEESLRIRGEDIDLHLSEEKSIVEVVPLGKENVSLSHRNSLDSVNCFSSFYPNLVHLECQQKVEFSYNKYRIPQIIPTVKCMNQQGIALHRLGRKWVQTRCEEVKHLVPVLLKDEKNRDQSSYKTSWNTITVACVKTVLPSQMRERRPITIVIEEMQ